MTRDRGRFGVAAVVLATLGCGDSSPREAGDGLGGIGSAGASAGTGGGPDSAGEVGDEAGDAADAADTGDEGDAADDGAPVFDLGATPDAGGAEEDCEPPDILVVLDRSQSMHKVPAGDTPPDDMGGYMSSRWWLALEALEQFVAEYQFGIRIGLELFPEQADGCVTLAERVGGQGAGNDGCFTSQLVLPPALMAFPDFDAVLDPMTTLLCNETPISQALGDAGPALEPLADGMHDQYAVLITDGGESCDGDPLGAAQQLVDDYGVRTWVVAFGDAALTTNHNGLNRLACAGQTAKDFPVPCVDDGFGHYDAADPAGPALYIAAEDGQALADAFAELAGDLCCGNACPPA